VKLGEIPVGLNAEALERFPREDGADICGLRVLQITVGQKAGLRTRTRGDEDERPDACTG
jgi:hypothetical protein